MRMRRILKQKFYFLIAIFFTVWLFAGCKNDKSRIVDSFEFLGEAIGRSENFDKDTIVTPENIDSLYRQYNVEPLFNGDYYLIRSKQSYTTSRYLSRLIQMKNGKQSAAKTFYDSKIDANAVIRLRNQIVVGLNSLRENYYDSTFHKTTHQCRIIVLSDSLTPIVGKRFYSQKGYTYIESLMQNSDSTFFCSVVSEDSETSPYAHYQFRARYNLNIDRQTYITNSYEYKIWSEGLDLSKPDWGNDLSDELINQIKEEKSLENSFNNKEQNLTRKDSSSYLDSAKQKIKNPQKIEHKEVQELASTAKKEAIKVSLTKKERFSQALESKNWKEMKKLADEGYSSAYIPLAIHYLDNPNQHGLAKEYAQKAKRIGLPGADKVLNELNELDY